MVVFCHAKVLTLLGEGNVNQAVRRKRDNSTSQVSGYYPDDTDKFLKFAGKFLVACSRNFTSLAFELRVDEFRDVGS